MSTRRPGGGGGAPQDGAAGLIQVITQSVPGTNAAAYSFGDGPDALVALLPVVVTDGPFRLRSLQMRVDPTAGTATTQTIQPVIYADDGMGMPGELIAAGTPIPFTSLAAAYATQNFTFPSSLLPEGGPYYPGIRLSALLDTGNLQVGAGGVAASLPAEAALTDGVWSANIATNRIWFILSGYPA